MCPVVLAQKALKSEEIEKHRKDLIALTTPFEGASENIKRILSMTQKSWLLYGHPNQVATQDFAIFIAVHKEKLQLAINELKELSTKKSDNQRYILELFYYSEKTMAELDGLAKQAYANQQKWQEWAVKAAQVYDFLYTVKVGHSIPNYYGIFQMQQSKDAQEATIKVDDRNSALPIFSSFLWRELNDIWSFGITPVTITNELYRTDSRDMTPAAVPGHDYGHVFLNARDTPYDINERLEIIFANYKLYKKFRGLQKEEVSDRKRNIREGLWFYLSHEVNFSPSMQNKIDKYKASIFTLQSSFYGRFKNSNDFGDGFKPPVTEKEIFDEVSLFLSRF